MSWSELESHVRQLHLLGGLESLASWDSETFMPPRAAEVRGRQQAALRTVIHEGWVGEHLGRLLAAVGSGPEDARSQALLRVVRRERDQALRLPSSLVAALAEAEARGVERWKAARAERRFVLFRPALEELLQLKRRQAALLADGGEPYDALLELHEPGMRAAPLEPEFDRLQAGLVPLVARLAARPPPDDAFAWEPRWPEADQLRFCEGLLDAIGFDRQAGRVDTSVHPFCNGIAPDDVRLTTRIRFDDGLNAFFSALHEGGHGLYEQGLGREGTPLEAAPSMGLHESQSRLWENIIGRSRAFWEHHFPRLQERFPEALRGVTLERWLAAANNVRPSLIRVDADEVTYNLHVLARFRLERALFDGSLEAGGLPEAWTGQYRALLGVEPSHDGEGVLQDIHWALGAFGYFPSYAIGNMYAATLARAAEGALPSLWNDIRAGRLLPLRDWLRSHVHQVGRAREAEEIVRAATGSGLTESDFLRYLEQKFGDRG